MREIKFRAWMVEDQMMMSWDDINGSDIAGSIMFMDMVQDELNYKMMQYTGLKDSDEVELYENDIVMDFRTGEYHQVIWDTSGGGFLFSNTNEEKSKLGAIDYYEFEELTGSLGFRVVGNVYEQPSLLGEQP